MIDFSPAALQPSYFLVSEQSTAVKKCLIDIYGLDDCTAETISEKISAAPSSLLDDFISLSRAVEFVLPKQEMDPSLAETDAVLLAPHFHQILFENEALRILDSTVRPGEFVPAHTHQWDSIMIILQGTKFLITAPSGLHSEGTFEPSINMFPGSLDFDSYTNIGDQEFRAISFEFKKQMLPQSI